MKIVLLFFILVLFSMTQAVSSPKIIKNKKDSILKLPPALEQKIKTYNQFQLFTKNNVPGQVQDEIYKERPGFLPMANVIDLNKDKKDDVVLMGFVLIQGKPFIEVIAFVSEQKTYKLHPIKRWKLPNLGVTYEKGQFSGEWPYYLLPLNAYEREANAVPAKSRGFKIEAYQGSTIVYYLDKGKFRFIQH